MGHTDARQRKLLTIVLALRKDASDLTFTKPADEVVEAMTRSVTPSTWTVYCSSLSAWPEHVVNGVDDGLTFLLHPDSPTSTSSTLCRSDFGSSGWA